MSIFQNVTQVARQLLIKTCASISPQQKYNISYIYDLLYFCWRWIDFILPL